MNDYSEIFNKADQLYQLGLEQFNQAKFTKAYDIFGEAMAVLSTARDEYLGIDPEKDRYDQMYDLKQTLGEKIYDFYKQNDTASKIMNAMGLAVLHFTPENHAMYGNDYDLTTNDQFTASEDYLPKTSTFAEPFYYAAYLLFINNFTYKELADDFPESGMASDIANRNTTIDWNEAAEKELAKGFAINPELLEMHNQLYAKLPESYRNPEWEKKFLPVLKTVAKK